MENDPFGPLMDAMDQIIEMLLGYRAKIIAAGFDDSTAEIMCADFHSMVMNTMISKLEH